MSNTQLLCNIRLWMCVFQRANLAFALYSLHSASSCVGLPISHCFTYITTLNMKHQNIVIIGGELYPQGELELT